MKFDFDDLEQRLNEFVSYFSINYDKIDRYFDTLISNCQNLIPEEKLFYLFLTTHFDSPETAKDFYQKLNWKILQQSNKNRIREILDEFFNKKRKIGDHRRHFRCMKREERVQYTVDVLESYKKVIEKYGPQVKFFEIERQPEFDTLYQKIEKIKGFDTRLPRFDHLERVSRTHNFYITPERFYAEEATGPLGGLTYLFLGIRYRKAEDKTAIKRYLTENFPMEWNAKVDKKYRISRRAKFEDVIQSLEQWVIDHVKKLLPPDKLNDAYVFDLESCLCNWQKGK